MNAGVDQDGKDQPAPNAFPIGIVFMVIVRNLLSAFVILGSLGKIATPQQTTKMETGVSGAPGPLVLSLVEPPESRPGPDFATIHLQVELVALARMMEALESRPDLAQGYFLVTIHSGANGLIMEPAPSHVVQELRPGPGHV